MDFTQRNNSASFLPINNAVDYSVELAVKANPNGASELFEELEAAGRCGSMGSTQQCASSSRKPQIPVIMAQKCWCGTGIASTPCTLLQLHPGAFSCAVNWTRKKFSSRISSHALLLWRANVFGGEPLCGCGMGTCGMGTCSPCGMGTCSPCGALLAPPGDKPSCWHPGACQHAAHCCGDSCGCLALHSDTRKQRAAGGSGRKMHGV